MLEPQTGTENSRRFTMAKQAKSSDVVQVALSSAFTHGEDVVCVPEASAAGYGLHAVEA